MHVDSWRAAYKGLVPDEYLDHLDYEKRAVWFREHLGESSPEIFVIVESEEVLGFLTVGPSRDGDLATSKVGEIHGIYLSPGRWRQGIGRRVCRYAEDLLLSRGYSGASLWVFAGNESAKRFYESVGFAADGASKVLDVGVALDAIRYRKDIRRAEQAPASGSPRFGAQPGSG
ncbi:MAG TPA: GNAT family N-acetyltransferase [Acidobacteriota bacterium]|nr:GNAT family N-acetyltransferase [Acidobacteriota bacterium]